MPAPTPRPKSRNWAFTLNNWSSEHLNTIDKWHSMHLTSYLIYGKEVGEEGTPHLQGYINLKQPSALSAMKKILSTAHWEICKGTPADNIAYCTKEDPEPTVYGVEPKTQQQANKDKATRFIELSKVGDFKTIEAEMPSKYIQMYKTMQQIATDNMVRPDDLDRPCGIWIYGETGCGKTTSARTEYGTYFSKTCNRWWDGYQGEDCVIIDDMDPNHNKLAYHLKLWTDKWSFTAEVKGGTRSLRPPIVIITSQYTIAQCFPDSPETVSALTRRCKVVHMFPEL